MHHPNRTRPVLATIASLAFIAVPLGAWAEDAPPRAKHLERKGDRIDARLDERGQRIDDRLERRADRIDGE